MPTLAEALARMLAATGVRLAFGVSGGGIGPVWRALLETDAIRTVHFRHEAGAGFAAVEASRASGAPVALFCTTGPGITNTLTAIAAGRVEGSKVVLVSGRTSPGQRGRGAVQETPMPSPDFFTPGWLFDEVFLPESADELPVLVRRLGSGFLRAGAYLAHVSIPLCLQDAPVPGTCGPAPGLRVPPCFPDPAAVEEVAAMFRTKRAALWVGHGATCAAPGIRALAERTGVPVIATPRGKGVFPEDHPQYVMVTGLGGHPQSKAYLDDYSPEAMLVLGTRLGEASGGWDSGLVPHDGYVHVDVDAAVPGRASEAPCLAIQADVAAFVDRLLRSEELPDRRFACPGPFPAATGPSENTSPVRPQVVFEAVQELAADPGLPVLVEPGGAMAWAAHLLRMRGPGQLRIVGSFGSMGHMTCGVLGAAIARGGPAVCVTGDGSMLMNNEVNTAATYGLPAVWIVLNNARYQMCEMGMKFGEDERHARFHRCDFVSVARGMGADGIAVTREGEMQGALRLALESGGPFVVDVRVDETVEPPFESRFETLR